MQAAERICWRAEEQGHPCPAAKAPSRWCITSAFALERGKGTFCPTSCSETRMLYPKEYAVGQRAPELVRQSSAAYSCWRTKRATLPCICSRCGGRYAVYDTVKIRQGGRRDHLRYLSLHFEEESLETTRLTVHPCLAARILRHTPWQDAGLESTQCFCSATAATRVCLQRINAILRQGI